MENLKSLYKVFSFTLIYSIHIFARVYLLHHVFIIIVPSDKTRNSHLVIAKNCLWNICSVKAWCRNRVASQLVGPLPSQSLEPCAGIRH